MSTLSELLELLVTGISGPAQYSSQVLTENVTEMYLRAWKLRHSLKYHLPTSLFSVPQVHPLYMCDASALEKTFNVTKCMVPEHFEKTIFLSAMYTFTVITILLCVAEIFEILCRRLGYLNNQWRIHTSTRKMTKGENIWHFLPVFIGLLVSCCWTSIEQEANVRAKPHLWSIVSQLHQEIWECATS